MNGVNFVTVFFNEYGYHPIGSDYTHYFKLKTYNGVFNRINSYGYVKNLNFMYYSILSIYQYECLINYENKGNFNNIKPFLERNNISIFKRK